MQTHRHEFYSDGMRLDGLLQLPDGPRAIPPRPVVVLCSGFQDARAREPREPKELIALPTAQHRDWIQPGHPTSAATVPRISDWFWHHVPVHAAQTCAERLYA